MSKTLADEMQELLKRQEDETYLQDTMNKAVEEQEDPLHKWLAKAYTTGQRPSLRHGLHLSTFRGKCKRHMMLSHLYLGNQVFHAQQTAATFEQGNDMHARWQQNLDRAGVTLDIEREHIETYWHILFTPDIIIEYEGEPMVVELKGYGISGFNTYPADAVLQCMTYMWFTGIRKGVVIVEAKNDQRFRCVEVKYDERQLQHLIPLFNEVKELCDQHMRDGSMPDRIDECPNPNTETAQKCGSCEACFTTPEQRKEMRRAVAWVS